MSHFHERHTAKYVSLVWVCAHSEIVQLQYYDIGYFALVWVCARSEIVQLQYYDNLFQLLFLFTSLVQ